MSPSSLNAFPLPHTYLYPNDPDGRRCQRNWSLSVGSIRSDFGNDLPIFLENIRKFYSNEHQPANTPTMVKMTVTLKSHHCPIHTNKCIGRVSISLDYVQLSLNEKEIKRMSTRCTRENRGDELIYLWLFSSLPPRTRQSLYRIWIVRPLSHCEYSNRWSNCANLKWFFFVIIIAFVLNVWLTWVHTYSVKNPASTFHPCLTYSMPVTGTDTNLGAECFACWNSWF